MLDTFQNHTKSSLGTNPEEILKSITDWNSPQKHIDNLREMMDSYFLCSETITESDKMQIYCTYKALYNALKKIQILEMEEE